MNTSRDPDVCIATCKSEHFSWTELSPQFITSAMWGSRSAGALWETYVVGQWLRYRDWHEPSLGIWYWRDQGGNEVDLLLERNQQLIAIECKLTERPEKRDLSGIRAAQRFFGREEFARSYLACPIDGSLDVEPDVTALSGWTRWSLEQSGSGPSPQTDGLNQ